MGEICKVLLKNGMQG